MGKILAYAALLDGKEVTWMPSYGPEQRGGTANVTVIISTESISSPILDNYDIAVILNQQSLDKFENSVKTGGTLIYDPYGIKNRPSRKDINIIEVPAMEAIFELGNAKAYNMLLLGALIAVKPVVSIEDVMHGLKKTLPERHHHLLEANEKAIRKGYEITTELLKKKST